MKVFENIKVLDNDPMESFKNKLTFCLKVDGKSFVAFLFDYNEKELWFRTRSGNIVMNQRAEIQNISKYVPKADRVV